MTSGHPLGVTKTGTLTMLVLAASSLSSSDLVSFLSEAMIPALLSASCCIASLTAFSAAATSLALSACSVRRSATAPR